MLNKKIIELYTEGLLKVLGDDIVSIVLYGSVARGTSTKESDVDIAVITKRVFDSSLREKVVDVTIEIDLECDLVTSIIDIEYNQFLEWRNTLPFYKNIIRDGIVLYGKDIKIYMDEVMSEIPRIRELKALDSHILYVEFYDGKIVEYDVKEDIENDIFGFDRLKKDIEFKNVRLDQSRTIVYWNNEIELPSDMIYEYGKEIEKNCST